MNNYDYAVQDWRIGRASSVLLGITLGFAGIVAIVGIGSDGFGNQLASMLVALASVAGSIACFRDARGWNRHLALAAQPAAARRLSRAHGLDTLNVRSTNQ